MSSQKPTGNFNILLIILISPPPLCLFKLVFYINFESNTCENDRGSQDAVTKPNKPISQLNFNLFCSQNCADRGSLQADNILTSFIQKTSEDTGRLCTLHSRYTSDPSEKNIFQPAANIYFQFKVLTVLMPFISTPIPLL